MKKLLLNLLFIAFVLLSGCNNNDELKSESKLITMWVSADTTITYLWVEDNYKDPIECMQVKYSPDGSWEPMLYGTIEYFEYEKGSGI